MAEKYTAWNRRLIRILWGLVIVCMLASLPLVYERYQMEGKFKKVQFVMDYRDLLDISVYRSNPRQFVDAQLEEMKARISSLAVYESTLNELSESRRVELYSSHDAAALMQKPANPNENFTYVLFTEKESQAQLLSLIQPTFQKLNITTHEWTYNNTKGLIIEMPLDEASLKPMDPDPITLQMLKDKGFHIVVRLSNRRQPFESADMDRLLGQLANQYQVKSMIVDGDAAPGYSEDGKAAENIAEMARLMKKYNMALAVIEPINLKVPQLGVTALSKALNYNVFRLHSLSEQDTDKLAENLTNNDLNGRIRGVSDRLVLAVKDRNVRMILLNAKATKNLGKATYADPLNAIYRSLIGKEGALNRIQNSGYSLGEAHALDFHANSWQKQLKPFAIVGSVALIALLIAAFFPVLLLPVFVVGLVGALGLSVLSTSAMQQMLALAVGISAVSLAIITAIQTLRRKARTLQTASITPGLLYTVMLFARTVSISALGAIFIVCLLNDVTYNLVLQQFKGVNILAFTPLVLSAIYLLFFSESLNLTQKIQKAKRMLTSSVSLLWIVSAVLLLGISYYYLTRTGNQGQASSFELLFRSFLEDTLKVRPRTKEFLIGNPLFILGIYLCLRGRLNALYLVLIGAIGQASFLGSFTHLHTPLKISIIRGAYGIIFGALIALVLIVIWEICSRGWKKWAHLLHE